MLETAVFVAGSFALLAAPLVPALRELRRPTDETPLMVYHGNAADAKEAVRLAVAAYLAAKAAGESAEDMVARQLGQDQVEVLAAGWLPHRLDRQKRNALCVGSCDIEDAFHEVLSVWAPRINVEGTGAFAGKLAGEFIHLQHRATVRNVQAPLIQTGSGAPAWAFATETLSLATPEGAKWLDMQKRFQASDCFVVKKNTRAMGLIIGTGDGIVEDGALVAGDIKAQGRLVIGDGVLVTGNVVADHIIVGKNAIIDGSLLAKESITLGHGVRIGSASCPATVAATDITLGKNISIHGAIVAHRQAQVNHDL